MTTMSGMDLNIMIIINEKRDLGLSEIIIYIYKKKFSIEIRAER
jgi:hypothetical protein